MQYVVPQDRTITSAPPPARQARGPRDATVQALVRAFAIIDTFATAPTPSLSVTEVAQRLHLHKSTAHRLLTTLERIGYVTQDEATQRYRLGLKVLDLAASVAAKVDVRARAVPVMERLVRAAQETVHLGVLIDDEVVCVESIASPRPVSLMRMVGKRGPVHVSSMGKVLLAYQSDEVIARVLATKGLPRLTERTITEPLVFREHLRAVRERGWAANTGEEEPGIGCVAAPVWNHQGEVIAALSIAAPETRLAGANVERLAELAVAGAREISEALGYHSDQGGTV